MGRCRKRSASSSACRCASNFSSQPRRSRGCNQAIVGVNCLKSASSQMGFIGGSPHLIVMMLNEAFFFFGSLKQQGSKGVQLCGANGVKKRRDDDFLNGHTQTCRRVLH